MKSVAYHEAGHAVACLILGIKFKHVSIIRDMSRNSLGHVLMANPKLTSEYDASDRNRLKAEKYISVCLAGPIAERKFLGKRNNIGASKDYEISFLVAGNLFGPTVLINSFMKFLEISTETLFTYLLEDEPPTDTDSWEDVKLVAQNLLKTEKMTYRQVLEILPHFK